MEQSFEFTKEQALTNESFKSRWCVLFYGGMWQAAGVAARQLQRTCRRCPAAALRFLAAVSSKKPDLTGSLKGVVARSTGTQEAPLRSALNGSSSTNRAPKRTAVDPATFRKQVQLSRDLISMRHIRWREVIPRVKLERIAGLPFDVYIFAAAITVLGSAKQFDDVMKLWQLMQRDGVKPNVPAYNALIDACSKSGHAAKACEYLQQMQAEGLKPNVITYCAAIDACARCGMADTACELLEQMVTSGITPNVISYSAVINACSKAGQYEHAITILRQMRSVGLTPNGRSYNSAIDACARCGQIEAARALLLEMVADGLTPDVINYGATINACSKKWQYNVGV
jgi:pentatricopeptide repeat protein